MKTVIFLQNAWSPVYAGRRWPRESWLRALIKSRSGQRLAHLTDDYTLCENTTPIVGDTPDSVIKPSEGHILSVLAEREPTVVITCGKQAEDVLSWIWSGPLIALPHPACRVLTNDLYVQAKGLLIDGFSRRVALRQRRGSVEVVEL